MAKTISELRNQSIQVRDASAAGENTATRVGTVLNDIVGHIEDYENTQSSNNSSQDAKIEGVKSSLNAEIARAKTEESNLSTQIGNERTERQAAVSREETARIQADNDEKTARQQADNAEQDARIKADNDEKTARENADITLRTMIQTEVSNRQIAVKQEEIRAMAAELANTQAIEDENARAKTAEQANAQAIADETTRATAEEERLQGEIDNTNTNVGTLENKVNSNHDHLTDEVARLDLTDNEIKANLEAETTRAEAAEKANADNIAKNAQAITDETTRAQAAEQAIIFDVSAYNKGAVFESLQALLSSSDLSTLIPTSVRHGGVSIRFIQSSDNKYVQYFLTKNEWSASEADWQKLNLEEEVIVLKTLLGTDAIDKSSSILSWNTGIINKHTKLPDTSYSSFCYAIIDAQKGDIIIYNNIESDLTMVAAAVSLVSGSGTEDDPYIFTPVLCFDTAYSEYRYYVESSGKIAIQARYPNQAQQISWISIAAQIVKGQIADDSIETRNIIDKSITSDKIADNVLNELPRFSFGYDAFVNSAIKEIYFTPSSLAHYASWSALYIVLTRKDFGNDHQYGIGLSPDESTTTYEWFWSLNSDHSICGNTTYGVYIVVDWTKVSSNQENYVGRHHKIDIAKAKIGNYSPTILNYLNNAVSTISAMNTQTNTDFANLCKTIGTTPMATWVDDDGVIDGEGGKNIQTIVVPTSESIGIPVTLGIICDDSRPLSATVNVGDVTMTKAEYLLSLQKKGFHITSHPHHEGWYGSHYDLSVVEPKLVENLTMLLLSGFIHSNLLIYPGSSNTYPDVVEIVRKWCVCGVIAGYGTPNHLGDSTKWQIKRTFINFENYYDLHHSDSGFVSAMAWYKEQVDSAFDNGDWIIFGTHCYQFTTSMDTTNPNANTLGNLQELFQYAKNKGVQFRTLWDAYNRRKYLFEFNEINR